MEIFFDAFSLPMGDVSEDVETLLIWTQPCPQPYAEGVFRPPLLKFTWGTSAALSDFQGFLSSVNATYTMFGVDGRPIRATCNITLAGGAEADHRHQPHVRRTPGLPIACADRGRNRCIPWLGRSTARRATGERWPT